MSSAGVAERDLARVGGATLSGEGLGGESAEIRASRDWAGLWRVICALARVGDIRARCRTSGPEDTN